MEQNPDINQHLAIRMKMIRQARGLSLDSLSEMSGVSQSVIDQMESGESSPTVAALWNLAQALQIEMAELFETQTRQGIRVIPAKSAPVFEGLGTGVVIRILSAPQSVGEHEIYDVRFSPGASLDSEPHRVGCREDVVVLDGSVTIKSGEEREELSVNDTANYAADCFHSITAGPEAARVLLIVQNS